MDGVELQKTLPEFLRKYRYVLLILLIGLCFMMIPKTEVIREQPVSQVQAGKSFQEQLEDILSQIEGAGKTKVLLTEAYGAKTYYQTDDDLSTTQSETDRRTDTVIVTNASREETGLIQRVDPPVYQGAIVVCQGADSAKVRYSIVEAVANATGLPTNKIAVLKMK